MDPRFYNKEGWVLFEDKICHFLPFYVGKGRYDRAHSHIKYSHNSEMAIKLDELNKEKRKPEVEIVYSDLSNLMAHNLENNIISLLRKQNIKLCNLTSHNKSYDYDEEIRVSNNFLEKKKNELILNTLNSSKTIGNAADTLGISQRSLYRKIKNLKIIKTKNGVSNYSYEFNT